MNTPAKPPPHSKGPADHPKDDAANRVPEGMEEHEPKGLPNSDRQKTETAGDE